MTANRYPSVDIGEAGPNYITLEKKSMLDGSNPRG